MTFRSVTSLVFLICVSAGVNAATYTNGIELSTGTGTNSAAIAIDFDGETYFSFEYRWSPGVTPTGWDALTAINSASNLFTIDYTDFGWGIMINDFIYPSGIKYDYTANGDTTNFYYWSYFEGNNESWTENMTGVMDRVLHNGDWDSWVWTNSYGEWPNSIIRKPGQDPVCFSTPEPMTAIFLGLGGFALIRRKK